jgi:hypothetical protein
MNRGQRIGVVCSVLWALAGAASGALLMPLASAAEFGALGKHEGMKQHTILDAGNVEQLRPPTGSSTAEVLKLNSTCLSRSGHTGYWSYGKKAGFILVDDGRSFKLAWLEVSGSAIEINIESVSIVRCPDGTFNVPHSPSTATPRGPSGSNVCQTLANYRDVMSRESLLRFCTLNFPANECAKCF